VSTHRAHSLLRGWIPETHPGQNKTGFGEGVDRLFPVLFGGQRGSLFRLPFFSNKFALTHPATLLGGWACTPLPDAENDPRPCAQQILFVALAVGQLSAQVISLDGANGQAAIETLIEVVDRGGEVIGRSGNQIASVAMTLPLILVNLWRPLLAKRIFLLISETNKHERLAMKYFPLVLCVILPFTALADSAGHKVIYDGGSPSAKVGASLYLYIDSGFIRLAEQKGGVVATIPAASVTEISYGQDFTAASERLSGSQS
jgi:hypothetical protein